MSEQELNIITDVELLKSKLQSVLDDFGLRKRNVNITLDLLNKTFIIMIYGKYQ